LTAGRRISCAGGRLGVRDVHRLGDLGRAQQGADETHVPQSFLTGGLGLAAAPDRVREREQLGRELIPLAIDLALGPVADRDRHHEVLGVVVGRLETEPALGADHLVARARGCPEAGGERGELVLREAHHGLRHLADLGEPLIRAGRAGGEHLDRILAEEMTRRLDAIDTDVVEIAAAQLVIQPDVARLDVHRERRVEDPRLAKLPGTGPGDRRQVGGFEVQAIGDHQSDIVLLSRLDHAFTIFLGDRHRLLAQHVDPRPGSPLGVLPMHAVRKRDVNRIDIAAGETAFIVVVGVTVADPVLAGELLQFDWIVRDERGQFGVSPRVRERRQYRRLRDVTEPDHRVADGWADG